MRRPPAALLLLATAWVLTAWAAAAWGAGAARAETVAAGLFDKGLLAGVPVPTTLRYRFERAGDEVEQLVTAPVTVEVAAAPGEGKRVLIRLFEGAGRREIGPITAKEQNPLVITFLQFDSNEMGRLTGGAAGYFQQRIRAALSAPAESAPLDVEVDGARHAATRLVIHPFRDDPAIDRFPKFRDKAYEFVVAPDLPGGIYRLGTVVPDLKDGHAVVSESITFTGAGP